LGDAFAMRHLLLALFVPLLLTACGPTSRTAAYERAAAEVCDNYYDRCGSIGAGENMRYASRQDCLTKERSNWSDLWSHERCDGKINDEELSICIQAIRITSCDSFIDAMNTLLNKCSQNKVCSGG
jgi:hypothetical protein